MKIYEFLARRGQPESYTGKILLVSFLGVHVPMFGAVAYALLADSTPFMEQIDVLIAMLIATLVGTCGTMFVMMALLAPITAATEAANAYLRDRKLPRLPTQYSDGAGVLMSSVQECITRLDSAIAATELSRQQLEQDHAAKFRVIAGMSHDFRTPLTHILGFAEIMRSEAIGPIGTEAYKKYITKIGTSGQDLLLTLNSVLNLSDAVVQRQLAEDSIDLDLVDIAQEAVSLEHLHAEKRGVTVMLQLPASVMAHTVRDVVRNMFVTLLQTAIAATPRGGRVILQLNADASFGIRNEAGQLTLEDVPPHLTQRLTGQLTSGTGSLAPVAETSTPMTLRLSLLDTLCSTIGADLHLSQDDAAGYALTIDLSPRPALVQAA